MKMYIKDTYSGEVREYGKDCHDSLRISNDGTYLTYKNLQCGDGSIVGLKELSGYLFCDDEGHTPEEDEVLCRHGADAYFNIGGFDNTKAVLDEIRAEILKLDDINPDYPMDRTTHISRNEVLEIIDKYKE